MSTQTGATTRRERRAAERSTRPRRRNAHSTSRRPNLTALSILGLVGGLAIVVAAIAFGGRPASTATAAEVTIGRAPAGIATDGFAIGSPEAPVTIDLYEDFQCPACEL